MNKHDSKTVTIRMYTSEFEALQARSGGKSVGVYIVEQIRKSLNHDVNIVKKLPVYNPAVHKAGDKVLIPRGKELVAAVVPDVDADGRLIPW